MLSGVDIFSEWRVPTKPSLVRYDFDQKKPEGWSGQPKTQWSNSVALDLTTDQYWYWHHHHIPKPLQLENIWWKCPGLNSSMAFKSNQNI